MLPAAQLHYNRFLLTTSLPLFVFLKHIPEFFYVSLDKIAFLPALCVLRHIAHFCCEFVQMFFQSGKHLPLAVLRLAGTIALFLRHVIVISISSIRTAVMPSDIMLTPSGIRIAPVVIRHHSAIICAVSPHTITFSSTFAVIVIVATTHLIKDSVVVLYFLIPVLSVLDIFVHINQLVCHFQISGGQSIISDFGQFVFNSCA
nr:MAG TPA_asm: hypothetical protein [Caudoviricetes sp.]